MVALRMLKFCLQGCAGEVYYGRLYLGGLIAPVWNYLKGADILYNMEAHRETCRAEKH